MRRAAAADSGRYLERLVEAEGKTMATARMRLAAIAAAHRMGGHEDPTTRPLVKATMKRLAREYGKPRKQAKGLGSGRGYVHVYGVHSGGVHPRSEQHEHGPGKGRNKLAIPRASPEHA